jgi:hypothetical protein
VSTGPVPIVDEPPPDVAQLATEGFATVVCLPLRDEAAAARVLDEWKDFNQTSPLVLFLDRLTALMLEYVQTDGAIEHRVMKRQRKIPTVAANQDGCGDRI